ncbi:MAG: bifunctional glutamate N-acetyltransferase/amino-acid acetyltransferase ArgJ [Natronincolaceae bacterium]|jgi:glutamate N-acetyltransferase/amino-acid N-acetyltransferase|nr:bifunctional glutamate N-acetyltransferase/amino-acid acetyltransferase ArgJ [Bacillota bacterium]NLK89990.1 bifunctional glutamate N-acetyltransferase/amino-acid acetyltransferase ArgJ [Clostridiales bacterium]
MGNFEVFDGDITSPKGYKASGLNIGLKKDKKDMALIVSDVLAKGAGVFTTNKACAAPILLCKKNITGAKIQAIIINSSNANACTGQKGYEDALAMAETTAGELGISSENVLVASTGVIGVPLPMETILNGIKKVVDSLSYEGGQAAAEAILTTDTCVKNIAVSVEIDGKQITIGGIAKGSGMIEPNMATMLAFVTTDANIEGAFLQKLLNNVVDKTYNMITVDGDTSTNDMVGVMANGMAENMIINEAHPEAEKFAKAFYYVNEYLAKLIVRDGEGATKFIEVEVMNAKSFADAKKVAKSILNSNLVKTAFFGEDANWGRIICSIGYSGADFDIDRIEVFLGKEGDMVKIIKDGRGTGFDEKYIDQILKERDLKIIVDLKNGNEGAKGWGCDLSYDYVKINVSYRS